MPWMRARAGLLALGLLLPLETGLADEEVDNVQEWWRKMWVDLDVRCGAHGGSLAGSGSAECDNIDRWNYAVSLSDMGRMADAVQELRTIVGGDASEELDFRYMVRRRLAEELLHNDEAKEAHKLVVQLLRDKQYQVSQRHTLSVLLRSIEGALEYQKPSEAMLAIDAAYGLFAKKFHSAYAGWGSSSYEQGEVEREGGIVKLKGVPTADELAGYVHRRQPFLIETPSGANGSDAGLAGLRALGLPKALAAFKPAKLAARAGDELVFSQVVKMTGHKDERSAARAVFAYDNEHHRRVFCNFSALLTDIFGRSAVGRKGEKSCLEERLGQPPPSDPIEGDEDAHWRTYLNIQANLLPPIEDEPYSRPLHRFQQDIPKPKCLKRFKLENVNLWMGRGATRSMLHHDRYDTLYVLLRGWKRFRVYPPSDALAARPVHPPRSVSSSGIISYATSVSHKHILASGEFSHLVRSDLGLGSPMPDEAHDLRSNALEVEIQPGQAFFLPGYWFHEVESEGEGGTGPHVAVSFDVSPPSDIDKRTLQARNKAQAEKRAAKRGRGATHTEL